MSDKNYQSIVAMFLTGASLRDIEKKTGINRKKISVFLKEKGYEITAKTGNSGYDKMAVYRLGEEMYQQGHSQKSICRTLKTSLVSFSRYLKTKGYQINSTMNPMRGAELQKKLSEALELYHQGLTRTQIARLVNVNDNILVSHFQALGIENSSGKYSYDERSFEKIETEEQAYWLGFLYADGSVTSTGRYVLELTLKEEDYLHLVKFKSFLKTEAPLIKRITRLQGKEFVSFRMSVYNKKMVEDLIRLGCIPRKSLKITLPSSEQVPADLLNHFVRGYFDGDGSIYVGDKHGHISLTSTDVFLYEIQRRYNLPGNKHHKKGNAFSFIYGKRSVLLPFLEALYDHSGIYLDRKYERYLRLMNVLTRQE
ncbi:hypothetical protein SAMN04487897_109108 [Paenibacillus sp. yr247]|uniref:LAGLIDADG family homing endonuclease n=1 Tax=Paenibacillus sp. yr247 TaxID=1761880 RepID=UPI000881D8D8|nr:LAGLIDADG family homing endonuclease [Paenibacillus sp. yr247]SDO17648.1 hypothetical protein SAMN04487897_109108 [Paenibacillus sp. yr247]